MKNYYRVKKDTFLWKEGAILQKEDSFNGYVAIMDVWDAVETVGKEYISARIVEDPKNADWFEKVYKDDVAGKLWKTKDQIVEAYKGAFGA